MSFACNPRNVRTYSGSRRMTISGISVSTLRDTGRSIMRGRSDELDAPAGRTAELMQDNRGIATSFPSVSALFRFGPGPIVHEFTSEYQGFTYRASKSNRFSAWGAGGMLIVW